MGSPREILDTTKGCSAEFFCQYIRAISAALGCPDAEPGDLAGMVAHNMGLFVHMKARLGEVTKERDVLRSKLEGLSNGYDLIAQERDVLRAMIKELKDAKVKA